MVDESQFVNSVGAALSTNGEAAELQFVRKNGTTAHVAFPTAGAAALLLNIEKVLAELFEKQRQMLKGQDPRTFFPVGSKRVKALKPSIANGHPILSLELESGMRLDFGLPENAIPELIAWLQDWENARTQQEPAKH